MPGIYDGSNTGADAGRPSAFISFFKEESFMKLFARKWAVLILALASLSAMTITAAANDEQEGAGMAGGMMMGGGMAPHMLGQLNLTADQVAKLKEQKHTVQKQMIQDMAEAKTLHLDLKAEIEKDNPDMDKVDKLVKQISDQQAKMLSAHVKGMIFFRSLLTAEQKKKLDEMSLSNGGFRGHRMMMMKKGGHGPMGKDDKKCDDTKCEDSK